MFRARCGRSTPSAAAICAACLLPVLLASAEEAVYGQVLGSGRGLAEEAAGTSDSEPHSAPRVRLREETASPQAAAKATGRGPKRRSRTEDLLSRRHGDSGKRGIVRHFQLPGQFPAAHAPEHVIMHVFIKALQTEEGVTFRGLMFAASVERKWYALKDAYMCQPFFEKHAYPGIFLREIAGAGQDAREWRLVTYAENLDMHETDEPADGTSERRRICTPVPFEGTLAEEDAMRDFQLRVAGFDSYALYAPGRAMRAAPRPKQPDYAPGPRVAAVVHPFLHPTPQAVVNRILLHYVAYHIRIGFAQVVQYTQVTYLRGFYADERVMAYVRAGHLVLQPWTDLAECAGPAHMKCWQTMVYSHAALDAWGSGTAYLLYADPDEYLVFPNQAAVGSVGDVLRWCTNDAAQVHNGVGFVEDDSKPLRLNGDCGFMLHVLNQFGYRDFDEATVTDTSWHWALNGTF